MAQSWIDIFGARMSKAGGSLVTNAFSSSIPDLINVGGSVAAAGAASLIWVAWLMGKKFDELMETGEVIGSDSQVREGGVFFREHGDDVDDDDDR